MSEDFKGPWSVGSNVPGYLPEGDVSWFREFDDAKAHLIDLMESAADWADCDQPSEYGNIISNAQQDVNLWSHADSVTVHDPDQEHHQGVAWWIHEGTWEDYAEQDPDGYHDGWDECCSDCAIVIANDDTSGIDSKERVEEVYAGIRRYGDGHGVIVGGDAGFSMRACAVCREQLGGDRTYVTTI